MSLESLLREAARYLEMEMTPGPEKRDLLARIDKGLASECNKSGTNEDRWRHGYQDGLEAAARFMESRKVSASPFYAAALRKLAQAPGVPDGSLVTMPDGSRMYALGPCGDEEPESPPSEDC